MEVFKIRADVESILLDPAFPEIFDFKHDLETSPIIIFIGNPDDNNISETISVLSSLQRRK